MPLFEVLDWNVPSSVQSTMPSKKRKRSAFDEEDVRLGEAAINFERLVKQLEERGSTSPKEKKKAQGASIKPETKVERPSSRADRRPEGKKEKKAEKYSKEKPSGISEANETTQPRKNRVKENKSEQLGVVAASKPSEKSKSSKRSGLTPLQSKMRANLDGARFRFVIARGVVDEPPTVQLF